MREQFEEWYKERFPSSYVLNALRCYDPKDKNKYFHMNVQNCWEAWQDGYLECQKKYFEYKLTNDGRKQGLD